jgi:hypothetical protein
VSVRVLAFKGVREIDRAVAAVQVMQVNQVDASEVLLKWFNKALREHRHPVHLSLAIAREKIV